MKEYELTVKDYLNTCTLVNVEVKDGRYTIEYPHMLGKLKKEVGSFDEMMKFIFKFSQAKINLFKDEYIEKNKISILISALTKYNLPLKQVREIAKYRLAEKRAGHLMLEAFKNLKETPVFMKYYVDSSRMKEMYLIQKQFGKQIAEKSIKLIQLDNSGDVLKFITRVYELPKEKRDRLLNKMFKWNIVSPEMIAIKWENISDHHFNAMTDDKITHCKVKAIHSLMTEWDNKEILEELIKSDIKKRNYELIYRIVSKKSNYWEKKVEEEKIEIIKHFLSVELEEKPNYVYEALIDGDVPLKKMIEYSQKNMDYSLADKIAHCYAVGKDLEVLDKIADNAQNEKLTRQYFWRVVDLEKGFRRDLILANNFDEEQIKVMSDLDIPEDGIKLIAKENIPSKVMFALGKMLKEPKKFPRKYVRKLLSKKNEWDQLWTKYHTAFGREILGQETHDNISVSVIEYKMNGRIKWYKGFVNEDDCRLIYVYALGELAYHENYSYDSVKSGFKWKLERIQNRIGSWVKTLKLDTELTDEIFHNETGSCYPGIRNWKEKAGITNVDKITFGEFLELAALFPRSETKEVVNAYKVIKGFGDESISEVLEKMKEEENGK